MVCSQEDLFCGTEGTKHHKVQLVRMLHIEFNRRYSQGRFQINTGRAPNHERVIAVKGDSLLSVSKLVSAGGTSKFDVIYIDGGHEVCMLACFCSVWDRLGAIQ